MRAKICWDTTDDIEIIELTKITDNRLKKDIIEISEENFNRINDAIQEYHNALSLLDGLWG